MKIARYLSISMVGIFVVSTGASADPSVPDPADNPYLQVDPDGVPLTVTQGQNVRLSAEDQEAIRKEEQKAASDKNWLLRNYEHQLQIHAAADSSQGENTNLYYQLSTNKALAKLAGLPELTVDDQNSPSAYRIGASPASPGSTNLRPDTASGSANDSVWNGDLFKPLVKPLSAPEASGLHDFYASLPTSMASPISGGSAPATPAQVEDQSQDSTDIETPGMVAAEKDPLMDPSATDLTLDVLPGESVEQAREEEADRSKLELPEAMDANQLHKSEAAALSAPSAQNTSQTPAPAPVAAKAVPVNEEDAPLPVSKEPPINPVRSPIANPYDILNR